MNQTSAMQYCKDFNATLPLPVSLLEFEVFSNFSSPDKTWIGISDPSNSGKKENWKDVENKPPVYVKPKVYNLMKFRKTLKYVIIPLVNENNIIIQTFQSGTRQSPTEMAQQHITTQRASPTLVKPKIIQLSAFKMLHVSIF